MTIQEMHIAFDLELDKTNSLQYPSFRPEEKDYWINRAISDIVKQRYTGNNPKKESVEETQKRRDDLRNITKNYISTFFINDPLLNKPNGVFITLPKDYYYALEEEVVLNCLDCRNQPTTKRVIVRAITHDRYNKMVRDPFNVPDDTEVYSLPYEDFRNELITGAPTSTVASYHLRYLRMPVAVNYFTSTSCDMSAHLHSEIITYAVNLAIENIESPRVVTQTSQINRNE
jgi:hypothetical protein